MFYCEYDKDLDQLDLIFIKELPNKSIFKHLGRLKDTDINYILDRCNKALIAYDRACADA
jgi:hypothetical protein